QPQQEDHLVFQDGGNHRPGAFALFGRRLARRDNGFRFPVILFYRRQSYLFRSIALQQNEQEPYNEQTSGRSPERISPVVKIFYRLAGEPQTEDAADGVARAPEPHHAPA